MGTGICLRYGDWQQPGQHRRSQRLPLSPKKLSGGGDGSQPVPALAPTSPGLAPPLAPWISNQWDCSQSSAFSCCHPHEGQEHRTPAPTPLSPPPRLCIPALAGHCSPSSLQGSLFQSRGRGKRSPCSPAFLLCQPGGAGVGRDAHCPTAIYIQKEEEEEEEEPFKAGIALGLTHHPHPRPASAPSSCCPGRKGLRD